MSVARLCLMVNRGLGGQAQLKDFIPVYEQEEPQEASSMEQIAALFGAKRKAHG